MSAKFKEIKIGNIENFAKNTFANGSNEVGINALMNEGTEATHIIRTKISKALDEANGRAYQHSYKTSKEVLDVILNAHRVIMANLPKKYAIGIHGTAESGSSVEKCYKYSRPSTVVSFALKNAGWYITNIKRNVIYEKGGHTTYQLTQGQRDFLSEKLKRKQDKEINVLKDMHSKQRYWNYKLSEGG